MKIPINILIVGAAVVLAAGCNKSDQGTATPPAEMNKAAGTAPAPKPETPPPTPAPAPDAAAPADKAAPPPPPPAAAAQDAGQNAAAGAQTQTDQTVAKNQSLLDSAKQLIADNKPADAMKILNDLGTAKLTPAQQSMLADLKRQAEALIEKLASSKATDAASGLLKK